MRWLISRLPKGNHTWWWWLGSVITLMLLIALLLRLDFSEFGALFRQLYLPYLLTALLCFFIEATVTTLRIRLFAPTRPSLWSATLANAWYVLFVLLLPARLGEFAAVAVFERFLDLKRGAALASIVAQRMFDVIVIAVLFTLASVAVIDIQTDQSALPVALLIIVAAVVCVVKLTPLLSLAARVFHGHTRPRLGLRRSLLRLILQGRHWHKQFMTTPRALHAFALSMTKWLATMAGIGMTMFALQVPITTLNVWAASAVYNFSAIVPLHTIGGIGVGEVGLATVLVSMGVMLGSAVGIALFVRMTLILFTLVYFAVVVSIGKMITNSLMVKADG